MTWTNGTAAGHLDDALHLSIPHPSMDQASDVEASSNNSHCKLAGQEGFQQHETRFYSAIAGISSAATVHPILFNFTASPNPQLLPSNHAFHNYRSHRRRRPPGHRCQRRQMLCPTQVRELSPGCHLHPLCQAHGSRVSGIFVTPSPKGNEIYKFCCRLFSFGSVCLDTSLDTELRPGKSKSILTWFQDKSLDNVYTVICVYKKVYVLSRL